MEGSLRIRHDSSSPSVLADLTVTQGCENELSPSYMNSNSNSPLTVENSKGRLQSAKDCLVAWTDAKHDLYLDHLESSFVKQLHRSIGVLAWCSKHHSKGPYLSQKQHAKAQNTFNEAGIHSDQISARHGKSLDCIEEFSDQNFADEASEHMMSKRSKTIVSKV